MVGNYDKEGSVTVRSQGEFNVALEDLPNHATILIDSVSTISISMETDKKIIVLGNTIALLYASIEVAVRDSARILAYNSSAVWLYGGSSGILYDNTKVMSMDDSRATLYDNSRSNAFDRSRVHLKDSSECCAFDSSAVSVRGTDNDKISVMIFSNKVRLFTSGLSNNTRVKNMTMSRNRGKTIQDFVSPNYK